MIASLIEYFREKVSPERIVLILTPLVLAPAGAAVTGWLAVHFPGIPPFDPMPVLTAGALAGATIGWKWLGGMAKWRALQAGGPIPTELITALIAATHLHPSQIQIEEDGRVRVPELENWGVTDDGRTTHEVTMPIPDLPDSEAHGGVSPDLSPPPVLIGAEPGQPPALDYGDDESTIGIFDGNRVDNEPARGGYPGTVVPPQASEGS